MRIAVLERHAGQARIIPPTSQCASESSACNADFLLSSAHQLYAWETLIALYFNLNTSPPQFPFPLSAEFTASLSNSRILLLYLAFLLI